MEPDDDVYAEGRPYELSLMQVEQLLHEAIERYQELRQQRGHTAAVEQAVQDTLHRLNDDDPGQEPDPDEVPF